MPDITMCEGRGCPQKDKCYRHTAEPDIVVQSYFGERVMGLDGTCEYFIPEKITVAKPRYGLK